MAALLAAPVSTGFVSRCLARLDARLVTGGFEEALKGGLRTAEVLGTDETPARVAQPGGHHVYTVRTLAAHTSGGPDLVWYGAADTRGHAAIDAFGLLPGHSGILVRDDYGGYAKYDTYLAGVQLCAAHLLRDLAGVETIDPSAPTPCAMPPPPPRYLCRLPRHRRRLRRPCRILRPKSWPSTPGTVASTSGSGTPTSGYARTPSSAYGSGLPCASVRWNRPAMDGTCLLPGP
jgi:hypothetical protein